jgi:tRNA U34 2-thiouridine synthase MnmA/TrmU
MVGPEDELAVDRVELAPAHLYRPGERVDRVQLRYRSSAVACTVDGDLEAGRHGTLTVMLHEPVHGVAPGQTACLMEGDTVLGHGTIHAASLTKLADLGEEAKPAG